jgi:type VI secretion system secreted protein VgrG
MPVAAQDQDQAGGKAPVVPRELRWSKLRNWLNWSKALPTEKAMEALLKEESGAFYLFSE